jgi:hypothetical protein
LEDSLHIDMALPTVALLHRVLPLYLLRTHCTTPLS